VVIESLGPEREEGDAIVGVLGKLGAVGAVYSFLRSPTGQRILEEVKRQAADPRNHRRAADLVDRLRSGKNKPIVVDADPPGR
jgi:hypothetical protein